MDVRSLRRNTLLCPILFTLCTEPEEPVIEMNSTDHGTQWMKDCGQNVSVDIKVKDKAM